MKNNIPCAFVILDGFGYRKERQYNAIAQANKPFLDYLIEHYPHTFLKASGSAVGLPEGYIGNSQVGHATIGSGKIIDQPFTIIEKAIANKALEHNKDLINAFSKLAKRGKTLHLIGLASDGGVHSHLNHLLSLIQIAKQNGIARIAVHAILDGRDVPPRSAYTFLKEIQKACDEQKETALATIHGRFYAMDRDRNWNRTKKSYSVLTESTQTRRSWKNVIAQAYGKKINDEFIEPIALEPGYHIQPEDGILFFNFRSDRSRQLTSCFMHDSMIPLKHPRIPLAFFITFFSYGKHIPTTTIFKKEKGPTSFITELDMHGFSLFSIAETEKYAHITYFFNGGKEEKCVHETRTLVPSLTKKQYIKNPCMSAPTITSLIKKSLQNKPCDLYLVNYANADMVGHSGDMHATIKAIECLDAQLEKLYSLFVVQNNGTLIITGDHGNAEQMFDEKTNQPHTAHTKNPVYFIIANKRVYDQKKKLPLQTLADIKSYSLHILTTDDDSAKPFFFRTVSSEK